MSASSGADWPERLFDGLLRAYPAAFREEYTVEMRTAFRDRLREVRATGGRRGLVALLVAITGDTAVNATREHLDRIGRDARDALRMLISRQALPSTVAAVLTLALATGAVTAIFSVVHAVLLAPLPYQEPDRIVRLWDTNDQLGLPQFSSSVPNFLDWQTRARSFTSLAALRNAEANLSGSGEPERASALAASAELWPLLGIRPVVGRTFTAEEDRPGGPAVILVSEGLWRRRFAADPGLPGRTMLVNGTAHTVVGVVPQDVGFSTEIDVWLPLAPDAARESRGDRRLAVVGRLAPGVSVAQADEEMDLIAAAIEEEHPSRDRGWRVRVAPIRDWLVNDALETRLLLLLAAVALLLLVACTNAANLQLARSLSRGHEIGLRMALGARRTRIVSQLTIESAMLAAVGGACGVALAASLVRIIPPVLPDSVPRSDTVALDAPVLLVALGTTLVTAVVFGVLPAVLASRADPQALVAKAGRSVAGTGATLVQRGLVAAQAAVAVMLVTGTALLVQSFLSLQQTPIGFNPEHVLTARMYRPGASEEDHKRQLAFYEAVLAEVSALHGVQAAGVTSAAPFSGGNTSMPIGPIPRPAHIPPVGIQASWRIVSAGYLDALDVDLVRGRFFDPARDQERPIVLSQALVDRLWPGGDDPIGREVFLGDGEVYTVIGVVGDLRQLGLDQPVTPTMYFPPTYFLWPTMTLAVRTAGDPTELASAVRAAVQRVDPAQPVFEVRSMRSLIDDSAAQPRLNTLLLGAFAGLALVLAAVGVAGVAACSVARRTRELALRLAVGATAGRVVRDVLGQELRTSVVGLAAGLLAAALLARLLSSLLVGVAPHDPLAFAVASLTLLAAALLTCWLPARRIARLDPMLLLRSD